MHSSPIDINQLPPGTVIKVHCLLYFHVGLLGDRRIDGERAVLSFSNKHGGYIEEKFSDFAAGKDVYIEPISGHLTPHEIMWRARQWKGLTYSWTSRNCEHFVRFALGLPVKSPQINQWAAFSGMLILLTQVAAAR